MAVKKSIELTAPYVSNTFNEATAALAGANGLLSGGAITVQTATTVDVAAYRFIQDGLIAEQTEATVGVTVPDFSLFAGPVHIIVSSPDAKDSSGITLTVSQSNEDVLASTVVVASRINNVWIQPAFLDLHGLYLQGLRAGADAPDGRLEDAEVSLRLYGGSPPQAVRVGPGRIVDSLGREQRLVADPSIGSFNSYSQNFDVPNIDPEFYRTDHLVLRRSSDNEIAPAQLVLAQGPTFTPDLSGSFNAASPSPLVVNSAASNTAPSVDDNEDGEPVVVWCNGSDIKFQLVSHAAPRANSGAVGTLAAGAGAKDIFITALPGRPSGGRLYGVLAADSPEEIVVFRTSTGGTALDNAITLTSMTNEALKPHMAIDSAGFAHIVFEHDETGANRFQVYYMKVDLEGTFGSVAVTPRIARGGDSGNNDTAPRIAISPDGRLHIALISHASGVTGDVVYVVLDKSGDVVSPATTISADVGNGSGSAAAFALDDNAHPAITVSPHGIVYVAWAATNGVSNPRSVIWEAGLKERCGFAATFGTTISGVNEAVWTNIFTDELGNVFFAAGHDGPSGVYSKYAPVLLSDGFRLAHDTLEGTIGKTTAGTTDRCGEARLSRDGNIQFVEVSGNDIRHEKYISQVFVLSSVSEAGIQGQKHPRDKYIGTVGISPEDTTDTIDEGKPIRSHPRRIGANDPFVAVGPNGDFAGFWAFHEASNFLWGKGGQVIVKGGYHRLVNVLNLYSGVHLVADGHVVLDVVSSHAGNNGFLALGEKSGTITQPGVSAFVYDPSLQRRYTPGDAFIHFDDTGSKPIGEGTGNYDGPYFVTDSQAGIINVYLNADISGLLTGNSVGIWARAGIGLDGFTIYDSRTDKSNELFLLRYLYGARFKNLTIYSDDAAGDLIKQEACINTLWENCLVQTGGGNDIDIDGTTEMLDIGTTIEGCSFSTGADIGDVNGVQRLKVGNSKSTTWSIQNHSDPPPTWTNNSGLISATTFDSFSVWGNDASQFVNRLVMNDDYTNGNMVNGLVPTVDNTGLLGTQSKRFGGMSTQFIGVRPDSGVGGLVFEGSFITSPYKFDASEMARFLDPDDEVSWIIEPTGRIARSNHLVDDFLYRLAGSAAEQWVDGTTVQLANIPHHYNVDAPSGSGGALQIVNSPPTGNPRDWAGAAEINVSTTGANGIKLHVEEPLYWKRIDGTSKKCIFVARYQIPDTGTNALTEVLHEIRLRDGGANYSFGVVFDTDVDGTNWEFEVREGATVVLTDMVAAALDSTVNFYVIIEATKATAWCTGMATPVVVDLDGAGGNPNPPASTTRFDLEWQVFSKNAGSGNRYGWLDYWELFYTDPISG